MLKVISLLLVILVSLMGTRSQAAKTQIARSSEDVVIKQKLFTWKLPKGWQPEATGGQPETSGSNISLKKGVTTLSLFIAKDNSAHSVDLQERQLRSQNAKDVRREKWNGLEWVTAEFDRKSSDGKGQQTVFFASTQTGGHLFSAMALTPQGVPAPDIRSALSGLKIK